MITSHYITPPRRSVLWRFALLLPITMALAAVPAYLIDLPQPPPTYLVQCSPGHGFKKHYARTHDDEAEANVDVIARIRSSDYAACSILPPIVEETP